MQELATIFSIFIELTLFSYETYCMKGKEIISAERYVSPFKRNLASSTLQVAWFPEFNQGENKQLIVRNIRAAGTLYQSSPVKPGAGSQQGAGGAAGNGTGGAAGSLTGGAAGNGTGAAAGNLTGGAAGNGTGAAAGNGTGGIGSLRLKIPNPGLGLDPSLNTTEAKELLKLIISNPLMKNKLDMALGNVGIQQGDWRGGCLGKDVKFPTIDLKPTSVTKPKNEKWDITNQIRINKYYGVKRDRFYVRNTGNGMISIKFEPDDPTSEATIRYKGWDDEYVLAKGDIYWSLDNNHGAQHAIDGQPFSLELQLVHYAKKHQSLQLAATKKGGIIVASILFETSGKDNFAVEPLANAAMTVAFPNSKWRQVHGPLDFKMLFPIEMGFYTYLGQYISEPCVENATWFVFRHPVMISYIQLQKFREVRGFDAKRATGVFVPLSTWKDSLEKQRAITKSGDEPDLVIVPEEALSAGIYLNPKLRLVYTALFFSFLLF